ncbi:type II secretion system F family protein [Aporhodopirellula aestuarii]|uniref:Type II secretion system protein GspF domain-containing protein n=1 Tax=Aporhodopirellula aestuarii TaxID=2950107 RepID=A0ABT0U8Z1_9BACT|nr:hypothetical protein [Aporhodopirellula aestuarii]MCM2373164.1 hypothetical protein [Aporhodopirellula aestuarii]
MTPSRVTVEGSIAQAAEAELWKNIRDETRSRLTRAITIAYLYLLASLIVGSYLINSVKEVGRDAVYFVGWEPTELNVSWMTQFVWSYGVLALLATIVYVLTILFIHNKLPTQLALTVGRMPWIGSTMRMVSMGSFCQSMYQSVARSQTYGDALATASEEVSDAALRRWSAMSAQRIRGGQSLTNVLQLCPVRDQPLSAVCVMVENARSVDESVRVWHHATMECHSMAQSRLTRATQFLSVSGLLVSVFLAAFAMLTASMFMSVVLVGLT